MLLTVSPDNAMSSVVACMSSKLVCSIIDLVIDSNAFKILRNSKKLNNYVIISYFYLPVAAVLYNLKWPFFNVIKYCNSVQNNLSINWTTNIQMKQELHIMFVHIIFNKNIDNTSLVWHLVSLVILLLLTNVLFILMFCLYYCPAFFHGKPDAITACGAYF